MEQNIPLKAFGECFRKIRKREKLTQTEIYAELYPEEDRGGRKHKEIHW